MIITYPIKHRVKMNTDINELHKKIHTLLSKLSTSDKNDFQGTCDELITTISALGTYTPNYWAFTQIKIWGDILEKIGHLDHYQEILGRITNFDPNATNESLNFISFEIRYAKDLNRQEACSALELLCIKHPNNTVFRLYYSSFVFYTQKVTLDKCFKAFQFGVNFYSENTFINADYYASIISSGIKLFYLCLEEQKYKEAEDVFDALSKLPNLQSDPHFQNLVAILPNTLKQSMANAHLIERSVTEVTDQLETITRESNKKSFEQLVIFTAIITFVITAAGSIMSNPTQLWALSGLGATLITFILCVLLFLDKPTFGALLKDFRFYVLVISATVTIWIASIATADKISIDCLFNCSYTLEVQHSFAKPNHEDSFPLPPLLLQASSK